jgi:hypothetical protein
MITTVFYYLSKKIRDVVSKKHLTDAQIKEQKRNLSAIYHTKPEDIYYEEMK